MLSMSSISMLRASGLLGPSSIDLPTAKTNSRQHCFVQLIDICALIWFCKLVCLMLVLCLTVSGNYGPPGDVSLPTACLLSFGHCKHGLGPSAISTTLLLLMLNRQEKTRRQAACLIVCQFLSWTIQPVPVNFNKLLSQEDRPASTHLECNNYGTL